VEFTESKKKDTRELEEKKKRDRPELDGRMRLG
jgi:hypothetical protein